jgi:GNAT superfamily N-acetyltransferase
MPRIQTRLALTEDDLASARELCLAWLDWHWDNYPDGWPQGDDHPMNPDTFRKTVATLGQLHERPEGGILLASLDGQDVGCVMYHASAIPDTAEFNRMYVDTAGRGHGIGRALLDAMFDQLKADGYRTVFFSSAVFLRHARTMYEAAGFQSIPHPDGFPPKWRDRIYFMERKLE